MAIKGYNTDSGYMRYVDGRYILFCSEGDFLDYVRELSDQTDDVTAKAA